MNYSF